MAYTAETAPLPHVGYLTHVRMSFVHAMLMMLRRSRILLAAAVTLLPVLVPLALAFLSDMRWSPDGEVTFVRMIEDLYMLILAPVLALFFATMLVGEDVEAQTIVYILVRPIPRSAWVIGRYLAFVFMCSTMLFVSASLVFAGCQALADFPMNADNLNRLLHYAAVMTGATAAYGAFCLFLGTYFKRPIIYGVLLLFGWQRLAMQIPGLIDFLTIQKYVEALYPAPPGKPDLQEFTETGLGFSKIGIPIEMRDAALALAVVCVVFVAFAAWAIRKREYPTARATGE